MTGEAAVSRRLLAVLVAAVALGGFTAQRSLMGEGEATDVGFDGPSSLPWAEQSTPLDAVPWTELDAPRNPFRPSTSVPPRPAPAAGATDAESSDDTADGGVDS